MYMTILFIAFNVSFLQCRLMPELHALAKAVYSFNIYGNLMFLPIPPIYPFVPDLKAF
jgi:hypothetical protein